MDKFNNLDGLVVPIDRSNVDTDGIIPKQFLKSIKRSGFGDNLFDEWRYEDYGEPDQSSAGRPLKKDFVLNQERYRNAQVLLARDNFGCGSSREHAVWALHDYGIRCVIAPSMADIFFGNCGKNGILAIQLPGDVIESLFADVFANPGYRLKVNLQAQTITRPDGSALGFDCDPALKHRLINGLDDIGVTLQQAAAIRDYEAARRKLTPWLFQDLQ